MRTVLLVAALVASAGPALARVYVCDVLHVYDVENGELVSSQQETGYMLTWPKIVFDDDTGIFKYGREGQWTEERMRVMSKGSDQCPRGQLVKRRPTLLALTQGDPQAYGGNRRAVGSVWGRRIFVVTRARHRWEGDSLSHKETSRFGHISILLQKSHLVAWSRELRRD